MLNRRAHRPLRGRTPYSAAKPGGLTVAAISAVFTIDYVADLLGEDEDWLCHLSINMFPEHGCLWSTASARTPAGLHPRASTT